MTGRVHPGRIAIVGVGYVGATTAYTLLLRGLASELVLYESVLGRGGPRYEPRLTLVLAS